ncbi:MAG: hypothetical protein M1817_002006 [Caeruleum heppii]|nr:MAG: hypothetical protein M1817_002006 [Caeruleum heppii]
MIQQRVLLKGQGSNSGHGAAGANECKGKALTVNRFKYNLIQSRPQSDPKRPIRDLPSSDRAKKRGSNGPQTSPVAHVESTLNKDPKPALVSPSSPRQRPDLVPRSSEPQEGRRSKSQDRIFSALLQSASREDPQGDANWVRRWVCHSTPANSKCEPDREMHPAIARLRSISTPNVIEASGTTCTSAQEGKNPGVKSVRFENWLEQAGIHMEHCAAAVPTQGSEDLCRILLNEEQPTPERTLFDGHGLYQRLKRWNEAKIVREVSPLLVPSAETLYLRGETHLEHVIDEVNGTWDRCSPLINGSSTRPDFSVGLKLTAFDKAQITTLLSYVGGLHSKSRFMATDAMYFPFLIAEVKCSKEALVVAERQNAHNASIAANAVVELYRAASRIQELDQEILVFSVSHDHSAVRIDGHYASITGEVVEFHRHCIYESSFVFGEDKWMAYQFTRNVYDTFLPIHFNRVCSALDQLPNLQAMPVQPLPAQPAMDQGDSRPPPTDSGRSESSFGITTSQMTERTLKRRKRKRADR